MKEFRDTEDAFWAGLRYGLFAAMVSCLTLALCYVGVYIATGFIR